MDEEQIRPFQEVMSEKSTEELRGILEEHDTETWREEVFEAIRRILDRRAKHLSDLEPIDKQPPIPLELPATLKGLTLFLLACTSLALLTAVLGIAFYHKHIGVDEILSVVMGMVLIASLLLLLRKESQGAWIAAHNALAYTLLRVISPIRKLDQIQTYHLTVVAILVASICIFWIQSPNRWPKKQSTPGA